MLVHYSLGAATQQCPVDFPFPFDYGKSCCSQGKDKDGNTISKYSETCLYDSYRPCPRDRCVENSKNQNKCLCNYH